jgi:hypothetical protein
MGVLLEQSGQRTRFGSVGGILGGGGAETWNDIALIERLLDQIELCLAGVVSIPIELHDLHEHQLEILEEVP